MSESTELKDYRRQARKWLADNMPVRGEFVPNENDPTAQERALIDGLQRSLHDAGYAGFTFPTEYGGQGLSLDHEVVFEEEATAYYTPSRYFGVSINIIGGTIEKFGTHQQKLDYIRPLLRGEKRGLQFLSEPSGGSDLAGLLTNAARDGDDYIVNGQKIWSTHAHLSDFAICPVRTRWDVPKHKGISVLLLDLTLPGIEIRRIKQINGESEFCEEYFTDVRVPVDSLLGEENDGWRVTRGLLEIEHAWVGRGGYVDSKPFTASALVDLAREAGLDTDKGVRRMITDTWVRTEVHKLAAARVSQGISLRALPSAYGGLLKLSHDLVRQQQAEVALRLAGAPGVAWDTTSPKRSSWAYDYLASRSLSIAGGTNEIQRNNVSERGLGLPREPNYDRDIPFSQLPRN